MLVLGIAVQWTWLGGIPVVSVVGFLAMLGGAVLAITSVGASSAAPTAKTEPTKNGFTGRMEERFRRRFEQE
jgi:hypothetical protein